MIVVDTGVLAYLLVPGKRTFQAKTVLHRDPEWRAPLLWRSEFRNLLFLYMRQKLLTREQALGLTDQAEQLLRGREYLVSSSSVLSLATQSTCSASDCEYVALAQNLSATMVTTDSDVLSSFPHIAVSLDHFAGSS